LLHHHRKEAGGRLLDSPAGGCTDPICWQPQSPQQLLGAQSLIASDAHHVAVGPQLPEGAVRIRIQVLRAEVFRASRLLSTAPLDPQVETGTEEFERLPVIAAPGDDAAEDGGEGVPGDTKPVRPSRVLASLVNQHLTDVEDDRPDGARVIHRGWGQGNDRARRSGPHRGP
jgi:hypothetical protein